MSGYYKPCKELDECRKLGVYWETKQFDIWFREHLKIANETSYPLAECQVGYCYLIGAGVEKDYEQAYYWTKRSAEHGDWDAQYNLGYMHENELIANASLQEAKYWYCEAAKQGHSLAIEKMKEIDEKLQK